MKASPISRRVRIELFRYGKVVPLTKTEVLDLSNEDFLALFDDDLISCSACGNYFLIKKYEPRFSSYYQIFKEISE